MVEELKELSSRVSTFLTDACEIDPGYQEAIPHVYWAWCHWCDEQGESNPGSTRSLAKELRTVLPKLSSDKSTKRDGKTLKLFTGLRLNDDYRTHVRAMGHTPIPQPVTQRPIPPEPQPPPAVRTPGPRRPDRRTVSVGPSAPPKPGGADTLFGGAATLFANPATRQTLQHTAVNVQRYTTDTLPRHRNTPSSPLRWRFGGASVAHQKATGSHKTDCATGATETRRLTRIRGRQGTPRQKEPQWSLSGGAGVRRRPTCRTWLVGY